MDIDNQSNLQLNWHSQCQRHQVKSFYKQHMPYAKVLNKEAVAALYLDTDIIACVRFRPIGQLTLLTGALVHPNYRKNKLGHELLNRVSPFFSTNKLFAFCQSHLVSFYLQHGFSQQDTVPNDIQQLHRRYHTQDKPLALLSY